MPTVSIIIPTHNGLERIPKTLTSVLNQTYQDVEYLLVDVHSDEHGYAEYLDNLSDRIRILHSDTANFAAAKNLGVREAAASYILLLPDYEWIEPAYVQTAVHMLTAAKADAVFCVPDQTDAVMLPWDVPAFSIASVLLEHVTSAGVMLRKALWEQLGGFDESIEDGLEDLDFWLTAQERRASIICLPEPLLHCQGKYTVEAARRIRIEKLMIDYYASLFRRHADFFQRHLEEYQLVLQRDWTHLSSAAKQYGKKSVHGLRNTLLHEE